jgi:phenylalanine-4-hydroxylase
MTMTERGSLLLDHVDMRMVATDLGESTANRNAIVQLDPDHPGFRDEEYRARRNHIAQIALEYEPGAPITKAPYSPEEHEVWRTIWEALEPAHKRHACTEYLECVRRLNLPRERIPQMSEVTERVEAISGFRLEPVAGLVEPRVFLESLADGVFLSTQYIRHHSTPLYTPEPDVAHEVIGHALTLADERLAQLNRLVGRCVKRTTSAEALDRLARVYWFTIEFGVLREEGKVKAYGTGLLSSAASRQEYDPTHYQPVLYCADSFDEMYQTLRDFLVSWK